MNETTGTVTVPAEPYGFTFDPKKVALLCIDFQRDFMETGGFGESLGNDVSTLRGSIKPTRAVLDMFREKGWMVIHTREGHREDLADLFPANRDRGNPTLRIGDDGPAAIRGALEGVPSSTRWNGVSVTGGTAGIVVKRKRDHGGDFLRDLWLAELIAGVNKK